MLSKIVKLAREELGLSQEELGDPVFSAAYIAALERGAVLPSSIALELIAERLHIAPARLFEASGNMRQPWGNESTRETGAEDIAPDVAAYEEDIHYHLDYATALINKSQVDEAMQLISAAEEMATYLARQVSAGCRCRIPYVRGKAYLQIGQAGLARPELESALDIIMSATPTSHAEQVIPGPAPGGQPVGSSKRVPPGVSAQLSGQPHNQGARVADDKLSEMEARVRNLLGVAYYMQDRLATAEEQHVLCRRAAEEGKIKDPGLKFSIYKNLASDYMSAGKYELAISVYNEATRLFKDLADPLRMASLEWALMRVYKSVGKLSLARSHAEEALRIYKEENVYASAAAIAINLAELLIIDGQYEEARKLLGEGEVFLQKWDANSEANAGATLGVSQQTAKPLATASIYTSHAMLSRAQGQLDQAIQYAQEGIRLAEAAYNMVVADPAQASTYAADYYGQALHIGALLQEDLGNTSRADELFERAITVARQAEYGKGLEELMHSYATVLSARGDSQRAMQYFEGAVKVRIGAG